jgi:tight adherence protein C
MSPQLWLLSGATLLSWAFSSSALAYVLLIQPLLEAPVHGPRGLKRARARSNQDGFARVEPLMRWVAARLTPFLSSASHARLQRKITVAGEVWGLWPAELRALSLMTGLLGAALGEAWVMLYDASGLIVLLGGGLGLLIPGMQLSSTASKRLHAIRRRIPHVIDLLVLSLGAGLDFAAALRQVVERAADPGSDVIEELGIVLEELKLGRTRRQALEQLAERAPCDEVRDLVAATVQAEEQGTPLGVVLQAQASVSRQRRSTRAEETAAKASTAMVLPLALIFVSLMILIVGPTVLDALKSSESMNGL